VQTYLDREIRHLLSRLAEADPERCAFLAATRDDGEALLNLEQQLMHTYPRLVQLLLSGRLPPA